MTVEIELGTLKDVANQCVKHSKEMDDEFTTWLYFIMELHESCQNEEGRGTELFQDIVSQEKAQTVYQEEQNKMLAEHKKKVEEMEKKVKEAHELYQKLHDEFPTG
ncbi:Calcium-binding protein P [Fusarium oxysporum f. sp. albedinis]|nr:Calcium-binding protein P [Fusarium oxysporum f. sp. albedinis]